MSVQQELLARAMALRSKAASKAHSLAIRYSITLSRVVFFGLLLLPLLEPNSFYIIRAGRVSLPAEQELHARSEIAPIAPSVSRGVTAEAEAPSAPVTGEPPSAKTIDSKGPDLPATDSPAPLQPLKPGDPQAAPAKPLPPSKQAALPWTDAEIASAKAQCAQLLANVTVVSEELPPAREGICGAPAPRELRSVGESKVKIEPPATLNCPMIAGLSTWITDKLQPAAQKNFGSPVARVIAESYSCRNRYGLARAPLSEHALMDAVDVSAFVLADGRIIRISKGWGPTAGDLKRAAAKSSEAPADEKIKGDKILVSASKLGAHDIAKQGEAKKGEDKPKSEEAEKEAAAKLASSTFLRQAHNDACDIFGTVLGPDTNDAHRDHFHLDMKVRKSQRGLCQ